MWLGWQASFGHNGLASLIADKSSNRNHVSPSTQGTPYIIGPEMYGEQVGTP